MIIRVWGVVNSKEVEFTPIVDRPGYWEGYAPRADVLDQEIEIWAKSDTGAIGHFACVVVVKESTPTISQIVLYPYSVKMVPAFDVSLYFQRKEELVWQTAQA